MNFENYINNELLEIYSKSRDNYNYEDFALGYIIKNFDNFFILKTIDEYGNVDSYTLMIKNDISKITFNTKYADIFKFYIDYNKNNNLFDPYNLKDNISHLISNDLIKIINICCQKQKIITIYTNDDETYHGNIIAFDQKLIAINESQYYKQFSNVNEDNKYIRLNKITAIDLLNKENFLYEKYLKNKHKN